MSVDRKLLSVDETMRVTAVNLGTGNHGPLHTDRIQLHVWARTWNKRLKLLILRCYQFWESLCIIPSQEICIDINECPHSVYEGCVYGIKQQKAEIKQC